RHLVDMAMPGEVAHARQRRLLLLAQHRIDLDQVDAERLVKRRQHPQRAQRIGHHGAAAGPEFDQPQQGRRPHRLPHRGRPQPKQFAEHLAHFGRGGEIALASERIARHVIAVVGVRQAQFHVAPDRHRSRRVDQPPEFDEQWRSLGHGVLSAEFDSGFGIPRRHATTIMTTPAMTIGADSNMPMVSPRHKNPSCGSGSRNNSPVIRAQPYSAMKLPRISPGRFRAPQRIMMARIVNSTTPSSPASYNWLGWRGNGPPLGNTMAQGRLGSAGRPHSSLLTKLANLPRNNPIGPTAVVMSPSERMGRLFWRQNSITAPTQPRKPP